MTKIKICGITNTKDALYLSNKDLWAMGFIFVKETPRYISFETAKKIIRLVPANVEKIGVFVNPEIEEIKKTVEIANITKIQLHGEESADFCKQVNELTGLEVIKAFRIGNLYDIKAVKLYQSVVNTILLDSYSKGQHGGSGKSFNWDLAKSLSDSDFNIILAGGINPDNVNEAITTVKPFAVDISSGVEASKGKKDHKKIDLLFENAYKI
ncbi:MAG: phosphoribosylanthranilate isomerase [bacterium]